MAFLDVNALVALAWDSHIHHVPMRRWFERNADRGWSTSSVTESGFVRVSTNPRVLPDPISFADARRVLSALRGNGAHRFLPDDISPTDPDFPSLDGYRQVTDAHLLTLARRHGESLVTFDRAIAKLAGDHGVEVLSAL